MPRQALQPEGLVTPKLPYSPVVVDGDLVYTAAKSDSTLTVSLSPTRTSRLKRAKRSRISADAWPLRAAALKTCSR